MSNQSNYGNNYGHDALLRAVFGVGGGPNGGGAAGGCGGGPANPITGVAGGGAGGIWWAAVPPGQQQVLSPATITTTTQQVRPFPYPYVDPDAAYRAAVRAFIMGVVMLMKKADIRKFKIDELHFMALGSLCSERISDPLSEQQLRTMNDVLMTDIESRPDALMGLQDGERVKFRRVSFKEFTTLSIVIEADGDQGAREISKVLDDVTAEAKYDELQEQKAAHG